MSDRLIQALQTGQPFSHATASIEILETHLSWIILTGTIAYKIKKPVNLGFQDFTTLEKRKYYCEKEYQLNQRLAPDLYLGVVAITGTEESPLVEASGIPIEYAIKMRQFEQNNVLSVLAKKNRLSFQCLNMLATQIADFHHNAERCPTQFNYGDPSTVMAPVNENFTVLKTLPAGQPHLSLIETIEHWAQHEGRVLYPLFAQRKANGFIRACHGDLHLGNMVMVDNRPLIFDCIEFNESFRWTDVMGDLGFIMMDLDHRQASAHAHYLLNQYIEKTQDYQGLRLLRFYQSYRAMVRAKISAFQLQMEISPEHRVALEQALQEYLALGLRYRHATPPTLTIMHGVSGSGKTHVSQNRLIEQGGIRLRSDVIRLARYPDVLTRYSASVTDSVYDTLAQHAHTILEAQYPVIIDAACLKREQRDRFFALAQRLNIPFRILSLDVPFATIETRVRTRQQSGHDLSEATVEIVKKQLQEQDPLSDTEKRYTQIIDEYAENSGRKTN